MPMPKLTRQPFPVALFLAALLTLTACTTTGSPPSSSPTSLTPSPSSSSTGTSSLTPVPPAPAPATSVDATIDALVRAAPKPTPTSEAPTPTPTPTPATVSPPFTLPPSPPPGLAHYAETTDGADGSFAADSVRVEHMRNAALSLGMRGALARRLYEIAQALERHAATLDRVFDFRALLIPAPEGFHVEPAIVSIGDHAATIDPDTGAQAAVTQQMIAVVEDCKLVTAPRTWRQYFDHADLLDVAPTYRVLLPSTTDHRAQWRRWVQEGWDIGLHQATEILEDDKERLLRDFVGQINGRILRAQAMATAPLVESDPRGVTGDTRTLRIGDTGVRMATRCLLDPDPSHWRPLSLPSADPSSLSRPGLAR